MKQILKLFIFVIYLGCSIPTETTKINTFIPPDDSNFSTVKNKNDLQGN